MSGGKNSIMLFGVQLTEGTNNTTSNNPQYQQPLHQQPFQVTEQVLDAANPPSSSMDTQTPGRKRVASGIVVEEIVEGRRQKRMTQNREAAARSRARKQAYIQELERRVSCLEEENEILRKKNEVKSSTIMEDEQIRQETLVLQPPPTPTAYRSTHNDGGIPDNPLPMVLGTIALPVLPLSWADLNGNGFFSSSETFPLS